MPSHSPIRLIVGLNNPGPEYTHTRHNAGAWLVEQLARQYQGDFRQEKKLSALAGKITIDQQDCRLLLPTTFMNRSGQAVRSALGFFNLTPSNMLVVHDELDLCPGTSKLKFAGGHGGHNGLRDIFSQVGSKDFYRLRIGIGKPIQASHTANYVLKAPSKSEQPLIDDSINQALHVLPHILNGNIDKAMLDLHTRS